MSTPINPIGASTGLAPIRFPSLVGERSQQANGFKEAFTEAVQDVEKYRQNATESVDRFLAGEGEDLHKVAMATQQAEMAFQLFLQVRNKVVQAYQEVMRMQV